jgi:pSer/pThr/pTyr-binding forkhead associated (FHA) protein
MLEISLNWQVHDHTHTHSIKAGQQVTIGRRDDCDVVLPFATISRRHAQIYSQGKGFYIRNLSQTNTVRVNDDERLAYNQAAPLQAGDVIRVGPIEILVEGLEAQKDLEKMKNKRLKIRCSNCGQVTDYNPESFCPWCGMSLAGSQTVVGIE